MCVAPRGQEREGDRRWLTEQPPEPDTLWAVFGRAALLRSAIGRGRRRLHGRPRGWSLRQPRGRRLEHVPALGGAQGDPPALLAAAGRQGQPGPGGSGQQGPRRRPPDSERPVGSRVPGDDRAVSPAVDPDAGDGREGQQGGRLGGGEGRQVVDDVAARRVGARGRRPASRPMPRHRGGRSGGRRGR